MSCLLYVRNVWILNDIKCHISKKKIFGII